jgi:hypothetical protein
MWMKCQQVDRQTEGKGGGVFYSITLLDANYTVNSWQMKYDYGTLVERY